MTARIIPLITDQDALYDAWVAARRAHAKAPGLETENAMLRAFKPFFVRFIGPGWKEDFAEQYRNEVAWCAMIARRRAAETGTHG